MDGNATDTMLGSWEPVLRFGIFGLTLLALLLVEALRPGPNADPQRKRRWPANFGLVILDTLIVRLLFPLGAVGVALWAAAGDIGLLHRLDWPGWVEAVLALLLLDLAIYWQHRLFHLVPWLWRWHRPHHTDATLDASSGVRFHPGEVLISFAIKLGLILAFGLPALAVLVFEILLSSFALFTHANVRLPARIEPAVRWLLVTPEMHVVHHSTLADEQHRNYGFHLSCWDRLFRSYAQASRQAQQLGVAGTRATDAWRVDRLLREPWRRD